MKKQEARTSIWVLCEDCGHTSRVLSVMASRVLKERKCCPQCESPNAPTLHYTASGAYIHADEAVRTMDTPVMEVEHSSSPAAWQAPRSARSLLSHPFAWLRETLS